MTGDKVTRKFQNFKKKIRPDQLNLRPIQLPVKPFLKNEETSCFLYP